jgi:hypothetical protein
MTDLPAAGKYQEIVLEIKQDATGGHAITFNDAFLNSHVPVIDTTASGVTTLTFYTYDDGTDRLLGFNTTQVNSLMMALSDETTALSTTSTTVPIITFRMPYAMLLTDIRASLTSASNSGNVIIGNIKESGIDIISTSLTIDVNEKTSVTAATPVVINDAALADDAEITVFLTGAGSNATGLKIVFVGHIV